MFIPFSLWKKISSSFCEDILIEINIEPIRDRTLTFEEFSKVKILPQIKKKLGDKEFFISFGIGFNEKALIKDIINMQLHYFLVKFDLFIIDSIPRNYFMGEKWVLCSDKSLEIFLNGKKWEVPSSRPIREVIIQNLTSFVVDPNVKFAGMLMKEEDLEKTIGEIVRETPFGQFFVTK